MSSAHSTLTITLWGVLCGVLVQLSLGLDDCTSAWHMEDVAQVFPFLPFGGHHKSEEQDKAGGGGDRPDSKSKV